MSEQESEQAADRVAAERAPRRPTSKRKSAAVAGASPSGHGPVLDAVPWGVQVAGAWSWRLLAVAGVFALCIWLVIQLRYLVIPLLVALLLSALLVPVVDRLERAGWRRGLAVAVTELGLIAVFSGLVTLVVLQVVGARHELQYRAIAALEQFQAFLLASPLQITQADLTEWLTGLGQQLQENTQWLLTGAASVGSVVGHFGAGLLLALFATIFILWDGRQIWAWIVGLLPRRARAAADAGGRAGWASLGSFIRTQILVALVDAIGIGIGAVFLVTPGLALPLAVLVFLGAFVPIVGAIVTGAVAVLFALLFNGWVAALVMLGVVLLVQQVEGHVLQPILMSSAVKIHPLAVVLAVTGGTMIAGIAGALFAVPLVALINSAAQTIAAGHWRADAAPTTTPSGKDEPDELR